MIDWDESFNLEQPGGILAQPADLLTGGDEDRPNIEAATPDGNGVVIGPGERCGLDQTVGDILRWAETRRLGDWQ